HDVPLGCAPDEYDDLISGTCSHLPQTSVRVWPQYGRVEIRGVLKTWIGDSKPFTDIKHYILILKRENGVTWLDNFGETDDEKK
ncbi:TraE/TraK family type IV conjugative transfer system protein, partial [Escherichia coli]|nr:TraE/TraK family type IV conjugative transfer system protein [Escherichia coli]